MPTFLPRVPKRCQWTAAPPMSGTLGGSNAPSVNTSTAAVPLRTCRFAWARRSASGSRPGTSSAARPARPRRSVSRSSVNGTTTCASCAGGDEHGLLARPQRGDGGSDGGLGRRKTRTGDIGRLHAGRHVEDEDGALVAGDQDGADGPRERQGQEQDGQDLQQQEQGRLQPAEGGARLLVPQAVRPEEGAAHERLATTDLEQVQEDDGRNAQQEEERRRIEKAHRRNPPRRR